MIKNRSSKFKILISILAVMILASLTPYLPAVLASTNQPPEVDTPNLYATAPDIEWEKTFGGSGNDYGYSVQQTNDGGFVFLGTTDSFGAGNSDIYLIKTDASGNQQWTKTFGGSSEEYGKSIQQTADGGFVIVGSTSSFGAGNNDVYIIKIDTLGNQLWSQTFGGPSEEYAESMQQTSDGGFIIVGQKNSFGSSGNNVYVIKTDSLGKAQWIKTYEGTKDDRGHSVQQTSDGGFIIAGTTDSFDAESYDVYLLKTDASGNQSWNKTFGGYHNDEGYSVLQTSDGGFVIVGSTSSFGAGSDIYIIKSDASGNELWQKTIGGPANDVGYSLIQTSDGDFIIAGYTNGSILSLTTADVYLIKTDSSGNKLWEKTFGGSASDIGYLVEQTSDGGFIIAGYTESYGAGSSDVYLIKVEAEGETHTPISQISKPILLSPSADQGNVILNPTLQWSSSTVATGFELILTENCDWSTPVINMSGSSALGSDSAFQVIQSLQYSSSYCWKVRAVNDYNDTMSPWSDIGIFTTLALQESNSSSSTSIPPWLIGGIGGGIAIAMIIGFVGIDRSLKKKRVINTRIKKLKSQMDNWRSEGYDVSDLEDLFK